MLVLSRKRNEAIIIGGHIVVTVVDIRGDKVRLGIWAPTETSVHRQEVYEAIQRENRQQPQTDGGGNRKPPRAEESSDSFGHLVLSRHRDESIVIGDDIIVTVVENRGDKVRLGIVAPIEISVHREEVHKAIQRDNGQASRHEPSDAPRQLERPTPPVRRDLRRTRTDG